MRLHVAGRRGEGGVLSRIGDCQRAGVGLAVMLMWTSGPWKMANSRLISPGNETILYRPVGIGGEQQEGKGCSSPGRWDGRTSFHVLRLKKHATLAQGLDPAWGGRGWKGRCTRYRPKKHNDDDDNDSDEGRIGGGAAVGRRTRSWKDQPAHGRLTSAARWFLGKAHTQTQADGMAVHMCMRIPGSFLSPSARVHVPCVVPRLLSSGCCLFDDGL